MKRLNNPRILVIVVLVALLLVVGIRQGGLPHGSQAYASATQNLSGYAWSSNIGWVSFNCTNDNSCAANNYGVAVDNGTGNFSGYAWSSSVGYISFNETAGCPESGCTTQPKLNKNTGAVTGWAKALTANGSGWDGWIKLDGVSFTGTTFTGYAWGSDVVGWLSWSGTGYAVASSANFIVTATLTANSYAIDSGKSAILTWSSTNATSCDFVGTPTNGISTAGSTAGSISTGALISTQNYQITCTGTSGVSAPALATVTVTTPYVSITAVPARVSQSGSTSIITWSASSVTSCEVTDSLGNKLATGNADNSNSFSKKSPYTTPPITSQMIYTIDCKTNGGADAIQSVTVNILPGFKEF